jgi:uncharacterized membrane protein
MIWYFFALVAIISHGITNFIDNFLATKLFSSKTTLMFYSSLLNLLFLPVLFLFYGLPSIPAIQYWGYIFIIGFIELAYLYPYYESLIQDDTSIVVSLFSIGKILVPILAYLFVGERLGLYHYIGFFIVIFSSFLLTYKGGLKFNKSLWYMFLCSLLLAIEAVICKYVLESVDWVSVFTWSTVVSFLLVFLFLISAHRQDIISSKKNFTANWKLFVLNEMLSFIGNAFSMLCFALAPLTLVKGFFSLQSVIVLVLGIVGMKLFPKYFKEEITASAIIKKIILFIIMIFGVWILLA